MGTGTITFALHGKTVTAYVSNAASKAAMIALANDLKSEGFTHAAIPTVTYCESNHVNLSGVAHPTADVGLFANCLVRRNSDGKLYGLLIHAPNMSIFETVNKQGYRVKAAQGQALAALYSSVAGEPFTFHEGWLQGSSLRGNLAPET